MTTLVVIQRQEEELDERIKREWKPIGQAWVSIEMLSGTELVAAQAIEARATHLIKTHWRTDIKPSDRLVAGETKYNLVSVNNVKQQNRGLEMMAIEVIT